MLVVGIIIAFELFLLILVLLLIWRAILGKSSVTLTVLPHINESNRGIKKLIGKFDSVIGSLERLGTNIAELTKLIKHNDTSSKSSE